MRALGCALVVLAIGCGNGQPPLVAVPPISDTFDDDAAGWKLQGFNTDARDYPKADTKTQVPATYDSAQRAITREETFYGYGDYFAAPSRYTGDRARYIGATLAFSLRVSVTDQPFAAALVVLQSGEGVWIYNGPPAPGTMWTDYAVPFSADGHWTDATTGIAITESQFVAGLTGITGLFIRGEFSSAVDSSWLDNVELAF